MQYQGAAPERDVRFDDSKMRVTVWNTLTKRKIGGMAAPMGRTLPTFLMENPHCEVYTNQDYVPPLPPASSSDRLAIPCPRTGRAIYPGETGYVAPDPDPYNTAPRQLISIAPPSSTGVSGGGRVPAAAAAPRVKKGDGARGLDMAMNARTLEYLNSLQVPAARRPPPPAPAPPPPAPPCPCCCHLLPNVPTGLIGPRLTHSGPGS